MTYNFLLSNYWTFRAGHGNHARKISKYLALALVNYVFNVVMFKILVEDFGVNAYLTMVLITGTIITWNFLLYRFWVFK
jgi:putative flippase GtrA